MHFVDFLDNLALVLYCVQSVVSVNAANHQDSSLQLDLAGYLGGEFTITGVDAARFQRAPEGAG